MNHLICKMKKYILKREQFISKPLKEVFSFFEKPENLTEITPKNLGFTILNSTPIKMEKDALISYRIKLLGIPVYWQTRISDYNAPHSFTDEQLKGPYSLWIHSHTFSESNGGTLMKDEVLYSIPLGLLGEIAHFIYVKKELENIFDFRASVISNIFSS